MTETAALTGTSTNGTGDGSAPAYQPIIRGERVFLRPAEKADVETFVRWFADSEMSGLLGMRAPMSLAMEEQWFARAVEQQGKDHFHFVICRMDNSQPIGTISLMHVDEAMPVWASRLARSRCGARATARTP
jgi:RimJ/RimL family protein N-acetyltransferase